MHKWLSSALVVFVMSVIACAAQHNRLKDDDPPTRWRWDQTGEFGVGDAKRNWFRRFSSKTRAAPAVPSATSSSPAKGDPTLMMADGDGGRHLSDDAPADLTMVTSGPAYWRIRGDRGANQLSHKNMADLVGRSKLSPAAFPGRWARRRHGSH
jgi:hypothetical protein